jgi:hypothetical protein
MSFLVVFVYKFLVVFVYKFLVVFVYKFLVVFVIYLLGGCLVTLLRRCNSNRNSRSSLCKVARHVLLQVEVGQLIALLNLEQRLQLSVGVDLATILLILKVVSANVGIDLTSHLCASKLCADWPSKKLSELLRNESGLDETGRGAVAGLALTLGSLLCSTHLTSNIALKGAEVTAERRKTGTKSVKLGAKLGKEGTERSLKSRAISVGITGGCRGSDSGGGGGGSNRGISLGRLRGLGPRSRYGSGSRSANDERGGKRSGC